MLRSDRFVTIAVLVTVCALPASAAAQQDLRSPDTRDAANGIGGHSPSSGGQDLRSPDARDAARDLPPVHTSAPLVQVRAVPDGGFDWGDAGIGAAGMLGLFSIAAGALLVAGTRRQRRLSVAPN